MLAMGGSNSADIAQEVHEKLLESEGAIDFDALLAYGVRLPSGNLLMGIYLDDYGVVALVPRHELIAARWGGE